MRSEAHTCALSVHRHPKRSQIEHWAHPADVAPLIQCWTCRSCGARLDHISADRTERENERKKEREERDLFPDPVEGKGLSNLVGLTPEVGTGGHHHHALHLRRQPCTNRFTSAKLGTQSKPALLDTRMPMFMRYGGGSGERRRAGGVACQT